MENERDCMRDIRAASGKAASREGVTRGFSTGRSYVTHAVTLIFRANFRAKERSKEIMFCFRIGTS